MGAHIGQPCGAGCGTVFTKSNYDPQNYLSYPGFANVAVCKACGTKRLDEVEAKKKRLEEIYMSHEEKTKQEITQLKQQVALLQAQMVSQQASIVTMGQMSKNHNRDS